MRRPEDVPPCGVISQQRLKHFLRDCPQVILPDVNTGRTQFFVWHSLRYALMRIAYLRNVGITIEHKKSMNDILIHASQALPQAHKIQISHAHANAQTLATYSSDFVLFECGRFVRLSE